MAKRKRASLKDKSSESLGLTPKKKGKGLDVLFGGPTEGQPGAAGQSGPTSGAVDDLSTLDDSGSAVASPGVSSIDDQGLVDELGLPVAMEAPPDDLILASLPVEPSSGAGEADAVDPSTSPFAMPDNAGPVTGDVNDLSGLMEEANSSLGEDGNLSSTFEENDLSGLVEDGSLSGMTGAEDLSGLMGDDPAADDLSGLIMDETAADDLSGLVVDEAATQNVPGVTPTGSGAGILSSVPAGGAGTGAPPAPVTPVFQPAPATPAPAPQPAPVPVVPTPVSPPPPTTAAPIGVQPTSPGVGVQPAPIPVSAPIGGSATAFPEPVAGMSTPPAPASNIPPPSIATGAPDLTPPRPADPIRLDAVDDNVVATIAAFGEGLTREDFKPKDELPDYELVVREDKPGELDAATQQQIMAYIGEKRRNELFERIQVMHDEVAQDLSGNKADVSFALDTLREANEYIIQKPYEYDEALYRVALVETMLNRKRKLTKSSYWIGLPILIYGIFWTIICLLGFAYSYRIDFAGLGVETNLIPIFQAVWLSGIAGGLGGTVEVFWRLYYRVSIKQDFDPQYLMYYIVKPILGFVLGLVMYFLISVGTSLGGGGVIESAQDNPTGFALTLIFGFIAGFRQESVFDMIYVIINKIAPDHKKGKGVKSVVPVDESELENLEESGSPSPATT